MTVQELYDSLSVWIKRGKGDIPVMIHDNISDGDFGYTELNEIESITQYERSSYWPEHLEIGRY